jgi:N-acetylneuraminate synthase
MIQIGNRTIGPGFPCFIIAEAGVNHNGDISHAKSLIDIAAEAGADAVKFQTFIAEEVVTQNAPKARYQVEATGASDSQQDLIRNLQLSYEEFVELSLYSQEKQILFLSTAFDIESLEFLVNLGVKALKIPSGEITNFPFLTKAARYQIPVILSTGMSSLGEVESAVHVIRKNGDPGLILLHCVSAYPADPSSCNLKAMKTMEISFNVPVGFSDHTQGIEIALAAVALGAPVIEKHFTLDRSLPGPDHAASLEPVEFGSLVKGIRNVESALGNGIKRQMLCEQNTAEVARRSIVAARDLLSGSLLKETDIAIKRPGTGLPSSMLPYILGKTLRMPILKDTLLTWDMVE